MTNTPYLRHAKDERKDHKYVARIPIKNPKKNGPKYRYFYTMAEWKAYQKWGKKLEDKLSKDEPKKQMTNGQNKVYTASPEVGKKLADKYLSKNSNTKSTELTDAGDKIKEFVSNVLKYGVGTSVMAEVFNWLQEKSHNVSIDDRSKEREEERKKKEERKKEAEEQARKKAEREKLVADAEAFKHTEAPKSFDDLNKLPSDIPDDEDREAINPYYTTDTPYDNDEYTTNCSYCTAAYDLRQRGYDVQAAAINPNDDPTTIDELVSWYDGAESQMLEDVINRHEDIRKDVNKNGYISVENATKAFTQDMLDQGEGARGFLLLYWSGGGGHAVAWEVENGEVVVRDCQTNRNVDMIEYIERSGYVAYFRTDNVEPNEEILKTVRNRQERDKT